MTDNRPSSEHEQTKGRSEELALLKQRADQLGIKYSGNVGLDTLRARVNERLEEGVIAKEHQLNKNALRKKIKEEQLKLVRIRLSCLNPAKKGWRGEVFTVANPYIGTVKKFVPFDPKFYQNGYHVPYCIYKMLKGKKFLNIVTQQDGPRTNVTTTYSPEFGIEVLPQLTAEELTELAKAQQAGNRID